MGKNTNYADLVMDTVVDLDGSWESSVSPDGPWAPISLPQNWFLAGIDDVETMWFRRRIDALDTQCQAIRFEGIDYEAIVRVDGHIVGRHVGGFAPFECPVNLTSRDHELVVEVVCPVETFGDVWPHTKSTIRGVMGHHDARPGNWGERGQEQSTGGIWGHVSLVGWNTARVDSVELRTMIAGPDAKIELAIGASIASEEPMWITARAVLQRSDPDRDPAEAEAPSRYELWTETWVEPGHQIIPIAGTLARPDLWWTWDHGEPTLYDLVVTIEHSAPPGSIEAGPHTVIASTERTIGLREITVSDSWEWRLNGRPIYIRGCNYIGAQWLSELTPERAEGDVSLAVNANLNLMRVHAHVTAPGFYDACDRAGVLVWQDLPMQWGYADSAETYRVTRSMVHELVLLHGWRPSIALWCAHNEAPWNEPWMAEEAGRFVPDQNLRLDHELADLFRQRDPSRRAIANSGVDDGHTYPGWYWGTWTDAAQLPGGAFVSEYGAQGVPNRQSLERILDPATATLEEWDYAGFQHHEHNIHVGVTILTHTVDEVIDASQRYQARQLQFATEFYRRRKRQRTHGVIPFMFVDPWPCISWSVLDYWRVPKPGYASLGRSMQPLLVSIESEDDTFTVDEPPSLGVWWINDHPYTFPATTLHWAVHQLVDNAVSASIDSGSMAVDIGADSARRVLQVGPIVGGVGRYRISGWLELRDGSRRGDNWWDIEIREGDES